MSSEYISKEKILQFMTMRMECLKDRGLKDFNGGLHSEFELHREVKWWKEAIERGQFDVDKG